ncbi:MAG: DUF507 family protein [bacterium]
MFSTTTRTRWTRQTWTTAECSPWSRPSSPASGTWSYESFLRSGGGVAEEGGAAVRLGREKINHLANLIVKELEESEEVDFFGESQDVRMNIVRGITNELVIDDEIDEEVRRILSSFSSRLVDGSRDWDILYAKHYEQEALRRGI